MNLKSLRQSFNRFYTGKRKTILRGTLTGLIGTALFAGWWFSSDSNGIQQSVGIEPPKQELGALPIVQPTLKYGFALDTFQVFENTIHSGAFLSDILLRHNLSYVDIERLASNAKPVFDIRKMQAGKSYTVLTKDSTQRAEYFIYEPNVYEYVVFHLQGDMEVTKVERPIITETKTSAGVIESSLWKTMTDQGMSFELADKMEDALQWSVDFHHLQKGDEFKLVYDQKFVEGKEVGVGKVSAAIYKTGEKEYYAIFYDNGKESGYYNLEGRPMKTSFLKAPVKYSRISSYYNLNRFHPILKYHRPHYGTDYAAPYGTPIMAVGSGTIIAASYTSGNGNFIKIRHDETYETQYLHMQGFAKGIHAGTHVNQGDIIGYVGSTGLATGPHVCFRFWKNGQQVNHLSLNFPPAEPLSDADMPAFSLLRDQYLEMLKTVEPKFVVEKEDADTSGVARVGNP
ncbi:MAG TPA: peptidoglycan DD-metalloendopeptidase family protein [Flavilitoribacter sp.]|nr:peptidoglycan DD-metalloendopeptidase family protein [Flavilitoribacter sp.]HMQ90861.1 peptidoglycan DD-metalloendopeptidase family protein [Flavilitoribacter sp.]